MGPTDKASKIPEKSQAPQSSQSRPSSHARARRDSAVDSGDGEPPSARPSMRTASSESKDGTKTYRSTTRHGEASRAPFVHPLKQPHCWKTLFLIHRASFHLIFQKSLVMAPNYIYYSTAQSLSPCLSLFKSSFEHLAS